jgi:hypothetical protein
LCNVCALTREHIAQPLVTRHHLTAAPDLVRSAALRLLFVAAFSMKSSAATYLYRLAHAKTDQTGAQNNPNSDAARSCRRRSRKHCGIQEPGQSVRRRTHAFEEVVSPDLDARS